MPRLPTLSDVHVRCVPCVPWGRRGWPVSRSVWSTPASSRSSWSTARVRIRRLHHRLDARVALLARTRGALGGRAAGLGLGGRVTAAFFAEALRLRASAARVAAAFLAASEAADGRPV